MGKFSETLMDHATSPRNSAVMAAADRTGVAGTPGRGAFLVLYLRLQDGRVAAASFQTYGCGTCVACGSMLTELAVGRTLDECQRLTSEDLVAALEGVPADKMHCPALALGALRDALENSSTTPPTGVVAEQG